MGSVAGLQASMSPNLSECPVGLYSSLLAAMLTIANYPTYSVGLFG